MAQATHAALIASVRNGLIVEKTGTAIGTQPKLNLIEGTNVTLTVANNPATQAVDVTIAASGGGGGGDNIQVNTVAVTDANLNDSSPAAPAGDLNVKWQRTGTGPDAVSAYVDVSVLEPLLSLGNLGARAHASLTGIGANDHHNQSHVLATTAGLGADHTTSGLTAGQVLRASGAATAAFAFLIHADLTGIGANDHHNQSHVLATTTGLGADHSTSGLTAGQVLRASGATAAAFAFLAHADLISIGANDHHNQSHVLATTAGLGADHSTSGLTAGQVLRASGATAAAFAFLAHADLTGIGANDHHNQSHVLATTAGLGADHTTSGLTAGQVLRASGATTAAFAQLAHADLSGLTVDDHSIYLLLAGRSGGQIAKGGTGTSDTLDLRSSSATNYLGTVHVGKGAGNVGTSSFYAMKLLDDGITVGFAALMAGIRMDSTVTQSANTAFGIPFIGLFMDAHTHTNASGISKLSSSVSFLAAPLLNNSQTTNITQFGSIGLYVNPTMTRTSSGTMAGGGITGLWFAPGAPPASVTVDTCYGMRLIDPGTPGGTLTEMAAVFLPNITAATTNLSIRSQGSAVELRHAGPGIFGADAAVTASTALEVSSTTGALLVSRMTTTQVNALTATDGMIVYDTTVGAFKFRKAGSWVTTP